MKKILFIALSFFATSSFAQKLSELPITTTIGSPDWLIALKVGASSANRITVDNFRNYILNSSGTGILPLANGGTNNSVGAATLSAITNDVTTNATMYPTWVTTTTGNLPLKVSNTKLFFNPSVSRLTVLGNIKVDSLTFGANPPPPLFDGWTVRGGSNVNSHTGLLATNFSTGTSASAQVSAFTNSDGTHGTDLIAYGANNTTWSWSADASAIYAESQMDRLVLATGGAAAPIWFAPAGVVTGGITTNGYMGIGTLTVSPAATLDVRGSALIGTGTALIGTEVLSIQKAQNASTEFYISNSTDGTAARAAFELLNNASQGLIVRAFSTSYTTSGMNIAGTGAILCNAASGLNIGTTGATNFGLWTNATERVRTNSNGGFIIIGGNLYMVNTVSNSNYWKGTLVNGVLTWTDTGSTAIPTTQ